MGVLHLLRYVPDVQHILTIIARAGQRRIRDFARSDSARLYAMPELNTISIGKMSFEALSFWFFIQ